MRRHIGHHRGGDVLLVAARGLIGVLARTVVA
jgi:hypothetical protein